jgi:hypothetical protein
LTSPVGKEDEELKILSGLTVYRGPQKDRKMVAGCYRFLESLKHWFCE